MCEWTYIGVPVRSHDDLLEGCTDIVYQIHFTNGTTYIGKKAVRSVRKRPPLKGYKRNRRILVNLPFENYIGSFEGHKDIKPEQIASKTILYQCSSRKASTYLEIETLFKTRALFKDSYINDNISGKFFKNSLDGLL